MVVRSKECRIRAVMPFSEVVALSALLSLEK